MRRRRHLSPDERALWDSVARQATPLDAKAAVRAPPAPGDDAPAAKPDADPRGPRRMPPPPDPAPPLPPFQVGSAAEQRAAHDLAPALGDRLRAAPMRMDARSFGRLKRGKLVPEGRIDLHGMSLGQAHPALTAFILRAFAAEKRLVLVITGKGKRPDDAGPIPQRHGVLRHQVPQWLALPPLDQAVLQIAPAHFRHGGEGAYYVYLRRRR